MVSVISGMSSIWTLTAITMERAWTIFCITRAKHNMITMTRMGVVVVAIWISAVGVSVAPVLGWNRYVYEVITLVRLLTLGMGCSRTL
jgi:hypothetical protein